MELGYMGHDQRGSDSDEDPADSRESRSAGRMPQGYAAARGMDPRPSGSRSTDPPTVEYMANQQRWEPSAGRLPDAEWDRLMREKRCFLCKEQGHPARECPTRWTGQGDGHMGRAAPPRGYSPRPTDSRR
jgi:hypothetical protein